MTVATTVLSHAKAAVLRERSIELLRMSAQAGDADLWGNTIRDAAINAALDLANEADALEKGIS